jgi:hypothetical protein
MTILDRLDAPTLAVWLLFLVLLAMGIVGILIPPCASRMREFYRRGGR